jgi:separase
LVANLWDVTDKDIDRLTKSVFDKVGLMETSKESNDSSMKMTVTEALARSRKECRLSFLNGSAPVCYGIPVRFRF